MSEAVGVKAVHEAKELRQKALEGGVPIGSGFMPHALSAQFTGKQMIVDPETGYLTPSNGKSIVGFSSMKKKRAVELADTMWPDIANISKSIGITRQTFLNHMAIDAKFRHDVEQIAEAKMDGIETRMLELSHEPKQYMDRITLLRAYRPNRYDPAKKMIIEHQKTNPDDAMARLNRLRAIEGEVVDNPGDNVDKPEATKEVNQPALPISKPASLEADTPKGGEVSPPIEGKPSA